MPSEKVLERKKAIVAGLTDELSKIQTLVLADGRGLTVAEDTELRTELRKAGVTYKVVKNTMASRAVKEAKIEGLDDLFKGPTAIAYNPNDAVAAARVLKTYADKFKALEIKGAAMDGKALTMDEFTQLASIPSVDVLYAKLLGGLLSPLTALAIYLNEIAKKCEEKGVETAEGVWEASTREAAGEDAAESVTEEA